MNSTIKKSNHQQHTDQGDEKTWRDARPANHHDIAALADRLWQERGCPIGSEQVDWFRAEELLRFWAN
jgi:hypothetical protein